MKYTEKNPADGSENKLLNFYLNDNGQIIELNIFTLSFVKLK